MSLTCITVSVSSYLTCSVGVCPFSFCFSFLFFFLNGIILIVDLPLCLVAEIVLKMLILPGDMMPKRSILFYRCNTSLLIDYCRSDGNHSYVLIDVGKTFREQVLRWFTRYNIPQVDSVSLLYEASLPRAFTTS